MTAKHYTPGDRHRGFPLGGGSIHPAAEAHQARQQARINAEWAALVDASGLRAEYDATRAALIEARDAHEANGCRLECAVADRLWTALDAYRAVMDRIEATP